MPIFDIAFIGTSLTASIWTAFDGVRINGGLWHPHAMAALSVGKTSELRYYNFGISGGTSYDGLAIIDQAAGMRAKVAVIEFCMNDSQTGNAVSLAESKANAEAMIDAFQDANPDILVGLMTMNPVLPSIVNRPNLGDYYEQYRTMVAARTDLFLIDNEPAWAGATTDEIPDGIHPLLPDLHERLTPDIVAAIGPFVP